MGEGKRRRAHCSNRVRVELHHGLDVVGITGTPKYDGIGWPSSTASELKAVRCLTGTRRCTSNSSVSRTAVEGYGSSDLLTARRMQFGVGLLN